MRQENPARLLIIAHDVVTPRMAGPGIRALELARALAADLPVMLAVPHPPTPTGGALQLIGYQPGRWSSLLPAVQAADALLVNPFTLLEFPDIRATDKPLAIDLYDPFLLENLQHLRDAPPAERAAVQSRDLGLLKDALDRGDFFLCANSRQRDAWLGALMGAGRINPATADADPTLESLIAEVPFGLPSASFAPSGEGPRRHFPTLRPNDRLILWGGGLWDWLDPLTAIRAMPILLEAEPWARLLFPGVRHPNPGVPLMRRTQAAMALADELGLAGREVLFGDWVPYHDWPAYLAESAVALTLHHPTLESRLAAVRSRVLSYIWAGLPIVATEGDAASDLVHAHGLGMVVPCGDAQAVADALRHLLHAGRAPYRAAFDALRPTLTWPQVAAPLRRFASAPYRAADHRSEQPSPPSPSWSLRQIIPALRRT